MASVRAMTKTYEQLTIKQKLFIEYYLQSFNATESAKKAGYVSKAKDPENAMKQMGFHLKTDLMPYMKERIEKIKGNPEEKAKKAIMDTDEILSKLSSIARGEEKDAFGLDTSNQDKLKALELLGKANQLYVERVKQDTNVDINVNLVDGGGEEPELIEGTVVEDTKMLDSGEEDELDGDKS